MKRRVFSLERISFHEEKERFCPDQIHLEAIHSEAPNICTRRKSASTKTEIDRFVETVIDTRNKPAEKRIKIDRKLQGKEGIVHSAC